MADTLKINSTETFEVPINEEYEYLNTEVNGSLKVNGSLILKSNYDESTQPSEASPKSTKDSESILQELDGPYLYLILGFIGAILYPAFKLKSPMLIFLVSLNLIILMLVILVDLAIIWFYIFILISGIMVSIASIVRYL